MSGLGFLYLHTLPNTQTDDLGVKHRISNKVIDFDLQFCFLYVPYLSACVWTF